MTILSVGDVIYTYDYRLLCTSQLSNVVVNIVERPVIIRDVIVSTNSKGASKVTYFDGRYYYNSKRVGTMPISTEDALKKLKKYIKYKSKFSIDRVFVCGKLIHS